MYKTKNISSLTKDVFPSNFMTSIKSAMLLGFSCYVVALLAWKGRKRLRKSRHTWMAEEAAISTNRETRKKPLPQSPPGKENRMSMFLRKRVTVGKAFRKMNGKFVEQNAFPTSLFLLFFISKIIVPECCMLCPTLSTTPLRILKVRYIGCTT